jgi:alpha-D-ribose 1-methylphosphonate 5-phosphate C-P lyase
VNVTGSTHCLHGRHAAAHGCDPPGMLKPGGAGAGAGEGIGTGAVGAGAGRVIGHENVSKVIETGADLRAPCG